MKKRYPFEARKLITRTATRIRHTTELVATLDNKKKMAYAKPTMSSAKARLTIKLFTWKVSKIKTDSIFAWSVHQVWSLDLVTRSVHPSLVFRSGRLVRLPTLYITCYDGLCFYNDVMTCFI